jgi:murein DD-endopeptidase MepM/ murein hydrolase activator NlpD
VLFLGPGPVSARRFSQRRQIAIAMAAAMACLWVVGGSIDFVLRHHAVSKMSRELVRLRATTLADAADRERSAGLRGDLDWHRAQARTAATETAALGSDLTNLAFLLEHPDLPGHDGDLPSRMSSAVAALAQAHGRQAALTVELASPQGQAPPRAADPHTDSKPGLTMDRHTSVSRPAAPSQPTSPAQSATLAVPDWVPNWQPGQTPDWASQIQQRLVDQEVAIDRALAERTSLLAKGAQTESDLARSETQRAGAEAGRVGAVADRDQALVRFNADTEANRRAMAQLTERTRASIDEVDKIVASTGLDLNHLAPVHLPDHHDDPTRPRGGPFVPWTNPAPDHATLQLAPGDALPDFERLQALARVLQRVPLSAPLRMVQVTSPFGYRLDPFTGAQSLHEGLDLEGSRDTPIMATAAGVVAFVGVRTDYGNMVELDHGSGLVTRYAHLDRALVQVGEHVALHQEIALMGATGRATGVHLHYEVRVDGVARNPVNFMKAKTYVPQQK